ncbi:hypothetical protein M413DRAFT_33156 [Hebeloma cylindrosporum]|uniref:Uncharacterized protein n=2 Tax=Hebeloma cylindrosporum TaxID=76867 RepID=A0A0C3BTE5_HEBCY|nr:hypothetical protein M413DRAFT_33156 [Hebeloma cylindrosporum h7]
MLPSRHLNSISLSLRRGKLRTPLSTAPWNRTWRATPQGAGAFAIGLRTRLSTGTFHLQPHFPSLMSEDAFPNAEQLFRAAFALRDPAPALLELLKAHPTRPAVMGLLAHYAEIAQENPSRANALTLALVAVRDSTDAPLIYGDSLAEQFSHELVDIHRCSFDDADNTHQHHKGFDPTDAFLLSSLLSGLSIKYDLADSSDQRGYLWESLEDTDDWQPTSEVRVVGACIQLLTSGSIIIQSSKPYVQSANEAAAKLKARKSKGVVKDSNALRVLELAISHAETGFKRENDLDNVWELLFPSQR